MGSLYDLKLNYSLKIFQNSTDDKFLNALDVYIGSVPRNEKTSTNEIIWCVDNASSFNKFTLYFLGLEDYWICGSGFNKTNSLYNT